VADPCDHADTQDGLGTPGITVEAGALYYPADDSSPNRPDLTGTLCTIEVDVACTVTVTENDTRGGVVLTDPDVEASVVLTGATSIAVPCGPGECMPEDHPDYSAWKSASANEPDCWCYRRQCHGDSDDTLEGSFIEGYYYVGYNDLAALIDAWKVLEPAGGMTPSGPGMPWPDPNICADFAHDIEGSFIEGYYRVGYNDLAILIEYWKVLQPAGGMTPSGPGIDPNCRRPDLDECEELYPD
jgi:hypothetical protein